MIAASDILIVGGGPVGATLALALQAHGIAASVLEARPAGAAHGDQRALALSYGSRRILERLGVWDDLADQATAIETIHVSQRGSLGRTRLRAQEHGQPALGYVLAYGALSAALDRALARQAGVQISHGAEVTQIEPDATGTAVRFSRDGSRHETRHALVVLADGGRSLGEVPGLRRKTREYGHDALVSKVACELPHANIAYERFTPAGPIALLPNGTRDFSLVWTGRQVEVQQLLALDDDEFLARLHAHFGDRVGRFLEIGKRLSFPLRLSYLDPVTAPHLVVIGNAAQTMHPVAGQGFNIGLRDAWELASLIARTPVPARGEEAMLQQYRQARRADTRGGILFTDFLVNVFSNELLGLGRLRGGGLGLLDLLPAAKGRLVEKMSFGG
jgi:2-octaprenyl-6-methoxyphenol hydroxylase